MIYIYRIVYIIIYIVYVYNFWNELSQVTSYFLLKKDQNFDKLISQY